MAEEHKPTIMDKYGNTINTTAVDVGEKILHYAGAFKYFNNIFPKLNEFQSRSTDVWICAYPKSGTNWMNEILCFLLRGGPSEALKATSMLDVCQSINELDGIPSPRILNTHIPFQYLPQHIKESKIVYMIRNPLSVALSYYYHAEAFHDYTGTAETFIESFAVTMYTFMGSWFRHVKDAYTLSKNGSTNILLLFYEEMLENPEQAVLELSQFLGCGATEDSIKNIVKQTSLKSMKERFQSHSFKFMKGSVFTRNGQAAEWKMHVSQEFLNNFMQIYTRELKDYPELMRRIKI